MFCCGRQRKKDKSWESDHDRTLELSNPDQLETEQLHSEIHPTRLQAGYIRLVELHPGDHASDIQCTLRERSLDSKPSCEALSYVWGNAMDQVEITVNHESWHVTSNLQIALNRLRSATSTRMLWVDALCINVRDLAERSEQVKIMVDIYATAQRVIVWLGPAPIVDAEIVKKTTQRVYDACKAYADQIGEDVIELSRGGFSLADANLNVSDVSNGSWLALADFFAVAWFTRCWCVQEIAKAKDSLILYGNTELAWKAIGITASWLRSVQTEADFELPPHVHEVDGSNALCMFEADQYAETGLLRMLSHFRDFHATDPCDKVYALLGLLKWPGDKCPIAVDYSKTVREQFTDTASWIIKEMGDLGVLSHVRHHGDYRGESDSPSWVPDWSESSNEMILWRGWSFEGDHVPYNACAGHELTSIPGVIDGALKIHGLRFDEAVQISAPLKPSMFTAQASNDDKRQLLDLWHECSAPSAPYENAFLAISRMSRTLTADLNADGGTSPDIG